MIHFRGTDHDNVYLLVCKVANIAEHVAMMTLWAESINTPSPDAWCQSRAPHRRSPPPSPALFDPNTQEYILNGNFVVSMFKKVMQFGGVLLEYTGSDSVTERINCSKPLEKELELYVSGRRRTGSWSGRSAHTLTGPYWQYVHTCVCVHVCVRVRACVRVRGRVRGRACMWV